MTTDMVDGGDARTVTLQSREITITLNGEVWNGEVAVEEKTWGQIKNMYN